MNYRKIGEGRPLLLIHGFPNDGSAWDPIVPALLSEGHCLIIPDLPGTAPSPRDQEALSLAEMADALVALLDHEGIASINVAGHSMGGYTALEMAARHPKYFKGLTLVHALASSDSEEKRKIRIKAIQLMQKGDRERDMFLKSMAQNLFAKQYTELCPLAWQQIVRNGQKVGTEGLVAFYTAILNRNDHSRLLKDLPFPIQWILGDQDKAAPLSEALEQCYLAPINQVDIYRFCGHMSFMEMPERLSKDLGDFVKFCHTHTGS